VYTVISTEGRNLNDSLGIDVTLYFGRVHVFLETEKNIYFQLMLQDDGLASLVNKSYWYDKDSKQTYKLKVTYTPQTEISNIIPQAIGIWENYYIGVIPAEQIEEIRDYQKKKKGTKDMLDIQNEELKNIINIKDDPNQAIVLYKIDFNN
jgi:NADH:ubiquinone oxidoreductase subunit